MLASERAARGDGSRLQPKSIWAFIHHPAMLLGMCAWYCVIAPAILFLILTMAWKDILHPHFPDEKLGLREPDVTKLKVMDSEFTGSHASSFQLCWHGPSVKVSIHVQAGTRPTGIGSEVILETDSRCHCWVTWFNVGFPMPGSTDNQVAWGGLCMTPRFGGALWPHRFVYRWRNWGQNSDLNCPLSQNQVVKDSSPQTLLSSQHNNYSCPRSLGTLTAHFSSKSGAKLCALHNLVSDTYALASGMERLVQAPDFWAFPLVHPSRKQSRMVLCEWGGVEG